MLLTAFASSAGSEEISFISSAASFTAFTSSSIRLRSVIESVASPPAPIASHDAIKLSATVFPSSAVSAVGLLSIKPAISV